MPAPQGAVVSARTAARLAGRSCGRRAPIFAPHCGAEKRHTQLFTQQGAVPSRAAHPTHQGACHVRRSTRAAVRTRQRIVRPGVRGVESIRNFPPAAQGMISDRRYGTTPCGTGRSGIVPCSAGCDLGSVVRYRTLRYGGEYGHYYSRWLLGHRTRRRRGCGRSRESWRAVFCLHRRRDHP